MNQGGQFLNAVRGHFYNADNTWDGHELLDTLRDQNVWNHIKEISKEKGVDITFESIKVMLGLALTSLLT
ncbi:MULTISPECIES: DUF2513 domain-containing protein [Acinetobacter]|uniref:DUF2513 domain-containing protein n=1 Tax=Acinetobacter TaxID=469 RepID=UPI0009D658B2|nr:MULTISPECIES: DUF2513 domain-containing protein [Acinetobacter]